MRVLCLGASKTGTTSIYRALKILGYTPHHMAEVMRSPARNLPLWSEAIALKYGDKAYGFSTPYSYGRREFDTLLGAYDAVADAPAAVFAPELITAYPEAKVILTIREVDAWLASMRSTVGVVHRWRSWPLLAWFDPQLAGPLMKFTKLLHRHWWHSERLEFEPGGPESQVFLKHYETVRKLVPKERLLEFRSQDGWELLCAFLGRDILVGVEYPRANEGKVWVEKFAELWYRAFKKMLWKLLYWVIPLAGVVLLNFGLMYDWRLSS